MSGVDHSAGQLVAEQLAGQLAALQLRLASANRPGSQTAVLTTIGQSTLTTR